MLMNYHEMTINEPRYSPAKRKQFLVICIVMASVFFYTCINSGVLLPIAPEPVQFEGGEYIYKFAQRDYAASMGLAKFIRREDLKIKTEYGVDDTAYHVYLDDPSIMGGRRMRWMTGILSRTAPEDQVATLVQLMHEFEASGQPKLDLQQSFSISTIDLWVMLPYERAELPTVDALALEFPFTNGFVSALVTSYKIIPAMRKLAIEKGEPGNVPVVISNCSIKAQMCTHYVPLKNGKEFLQGHPDTTAHNDALGKESFLDGKGMKEGFKKVFPFAYDYFFTDEVPSEDKSEL